MRRFFLFLIVVLVILGAGVYYLFANIDAIVKRAVESQGSKVTQTEVLLSAAEVSLQDSRATLTELSIANPSGFSPEHALSVGQISVDLDPSRLSRKVVAIKDITVMRPDVFFEIASGGGSNFNRLRENVTSRGGRSAGGPELIVDRLLISDGRLRVRAPSGRETTVNLPDITLSQLGTDANPITSAELGQRVVTAVLDKSLLAIAQNNILGLLDVDMSLGDLVTNTEGLSGPVQELLGDTGLGSIVEDVFGGLFGGDDDDKDDDGNN